MERLRIVAPGEVDDLRLGQREAAAVDGQAGSIVLEVPDRAIGNISHEEQYRGSARPAASRARAGFSALPSVSDYEMITEKTRFACEGPRVPAMLSLGGTAGGKPSQTSRKRRKHLK
jgi:hypothetical protein